MQYLVYLSSILIFYIFLKIKKSVISSFSLVMLPYVVILFFNNFFFKNYNFIKIGENTCFMLLIGIISFSFGALIISLTINNQKKSDYFFKSCLTNYQLDAISNYVLIVIVLRIAELFLLICKYGILGLLADDFKLLVTRGVIGHLLISIFPLIPILFYHYLQYHKRKYLFLCILFLILAFIETEKAQSISIVLATFLYCVFINKRYLKGGVFFIFFMIAFLFIGNYMIKFLLGGFFKDVDNSYYITRLWTYIAGGLINSNLITSSIGIQVSGFDYFEHVLFAFPNMFLGALANTQLGVQVSTYMPYIADFPYVTTVHDGFSAQTSNVISTMTFIYSNGNLLAFIPVCIFWGGICEYIMEKMRYCKNEFNLTFACCFMSFTMLSFFASYYSSASFVERLLYCLLFPIVLHTPIKRYIVKSY